MAMDRSPEVQIACLKETIHMKCQILFSGKNKKKIFKMSSAEYFTQHAKS